ncbi:uncharacterized protein [Typha angustifolia]|uniref:uncharacterized protein isoform X2 n=1 Tax=Typha angustifolia TaxID=59011 RepID=UPI003C2D6A66
MHDLFHDLAERISEEDCLRIEDDQVKEIPLTIRRLNISSESIRKNRMSFNSLENLHTLIFHGSHTIDGTDYVTMAIRKFKKLRVLKIYDLSIQTLPKSIGDLKHLRYLNLNWTGVAELPVVLGRLYYLQTLCTPYHATTSPRSLKNLINLRHFNGDSKALTSLPDIGRLTSLQTLAKFHVKKKKGYNIGQLKNLNEIRGSLSISYLENIEGKDKAIEANLKNKKYLESLELNWDYDDERECRRDLDREVLEGLQPHPPNLRNLSIYGYMSPEFPSWLPLRNLRSLEFCNCAALEALPPMSDLFPHCQDIKIWGLPNLRGFPLLPPSLKDLEIADCQSLVFMSKEEVEERAEDIFGGKEKIELILPSQLQGLKIRYCNITDEALSQSLVRLTSLKSLDITECAITTLPSEKILHHLTALTHLEITLCPWLESLRGLYALPSLEKLVIGDCDYLELKMVMPGEGGGRGILPSSLRELEIRYCRSMKSFVVAAGDLPNLASLEFYDCPSLAFMSLSCLTGFTRLNIRRCPSLASLSLSLLIALTFLEVGECPKLSSLPSNLPESLKELRLVSCPAISSLSNLPKSLKEGILSLPDLPESLMHIHIWWCPVLEERCRSPDGEDWPKIARIPNRKIGEREGFIHAGCRFGASSDALFLWSLYSSDLENMGLYPGPNMWASIVSCTRMTVSNTCLPVLCLSQNNSFVYSAVAEDAFEVQYLEPYCKYSAMSPVFALFIEQLSTDVFKIEQNGLALEYFLLGRHLMSYIIA